MEDYGRWPECETCSRTFQTQRACDRHMNDRHHWAPRYECETCDREFFSQNAANQHMTDTGHWKPKVHCETCNRKFYTQNAANQHMDALDHWAPEFPCEKCTLIFRSQEAADRHMEEKSHFRNYCAACKRRFQNENNLQMVGISSTRVALNAHQFPQHLRSKVHLGSRIACPFCKTGFTTASGLTHHLETGSCPNARSLNRDIIYKMIRERDPNGVVTKKQIEWHGDESASYSVTNRAFNGQYWECYLCHRLFNKARYLEQHLNSSAHRQKGYHCPNLKVKCGKEFITLAGLFNHLESESCGFMRFEKVEKRVGDVIQGRKLIAF